MDKNHFSRIERRIQALIEGGFARLFAGRLHAREVALELARAMEDHAQVDAEAHLAAPNRYIVRMHPVDLAALLKAEPELARLMAQHLVELARESEMRLDALPDVVLTGLESVPPHTIQVTARYVASAAQSTQAMTPVQRAAALPSAPGDDLPPAFLIVDGDRYIPLQRAIVNLGRRHDNTIVIDDPRVSRQHAQLRFRFGHFVLYDLGSRGGTTVNGAPITECVLRTNDVIGLAGVRLVYVEEDASTGAQAARGLTRGGDTQVRSGPPAPPELPLAPESADDDGDEPLLWDDEDGDGGY